MAAQKYDWGDGKGAVHTIPLAKHQQDVAFKNPNSPDLGQIVAAGGLPQAQAAGLQATPTPASAQPVDPNLANETLTAGRNVALGNATAAQTIGNAEFDYGLNPDGSVNTSNPFSRAALLEDSYHNSQASTKTNMAAQGQYRSSAYGAAQGINDNAYAQNAAENSTAFMRAIQAAQAAQLGTYANNALGVGDQDFTSLLNNFSGSS